MPIATNTSIQTEFFILNCKVTNIYQLLTVRLSGSADFWLEDTTFFHSGLEVAFSSFLWRA